MEKTNIVLTGFMGTGKTAVGKRLARRLAYEFVDTDDLIQERTGRTIPEVFAEMGESAFREMEAEVARELSGKQGLVIATGGRLMLDPDNAALLGRTGRVFYLAATPDDIYERVSKDSEYERPLLAGPDPKARIIELMRERQDGYAAFQEIVTSGKTPDAVADILYGILKADE